MNDLWYYRAIVEIENEYANGTLSQKDFKQAMRDLDSEWDDAYRIDKEKYE